MYFTSIFFFFFFCLFITVLVRRIRQNLGQKIVLTTYLDLLFRNPPPKKKKKKKKERNWLFSTDFITFSYSTSLSKEHSIILYICTCLRE